MPSATTTHQAEAARPLLPDPGLRAGAALQAAALPVGARARTNGGHVEADVTAGEDLVPKPALQDEAAESGQVARVGRLPFGPARRGARACPGREAVSERQQRLFLLHSL